MIKDGAWVTETLSRKNFEDDSFPYFIRAIAKNLEIDFLSDREFRTAIMKTLLDDINSSTSLTAEGKEFLASTCLIRFAVMSDEELDKYVCQTENLG